METLKDMENLRFSEYNNDLIQGGLDECLPESRNDRSESKIGTTGQVVLHLFDSSVYLSLVIVLLLMFGYIVLVSLL